MQWPRGIRPKGDKGIEIEIRFEGRHRPTLRLDPTLKSNRNAAEATKRRIDDAIDLWKVKRITRDDVIEEIEKHFPNFEEEFIKAKQQKTEKQTAVVEKTDMSLFGNFILNWWEKVKKPEVEGVTVRQWESIIGWFAKKFGHLRMTKDDSNELTITIFTNWISDLRELGRSRKNITNRIAPVRLALDAAVEAGKLSFNPARLAKIRTTKAEKRARYIKKEVDPFDIDEIFKLKKAALDMRLPRLHRMITVGFGAGLRLEELFALAVEDIDFARSTITINIAIVEKEYKIPKTSRSHRTIVVDKEVMQALKEQINDTGLMPPVDCGEFGERRIIFYNDVTNKPWVEDGQLRTRIWKNMCRKAGIRYRPPKQMRHTFACLCLISGKDEKWVADYLGHETTQMVQRHYGKLLSKLRAAKRVMGITETPDLQGAYGNSSEEKIQSLQDIFNQAA